MNNVAISNGFLLWSELCAIWSIFSYGVAADPLPEDRENPNFSWTTWRTSMPIRTVGIGLLTYLLTHSVIMTGWLMTIATIHPWIRLRSPLQWTAEIEVTIVVLNILLVLAFIRSLTLQTHINVPNPPRAEHISALSIVVAVLLSVVRGGTYIVRGCLRKTGALPHLRSGAAPSKSATTDPVGLPCTSPSTATDDVQLDVTEINRGRLIGNLERLVLTLVVAVGSYAALAFLVAAKGLIRSEDLERRDFAEYFLIGSLSSALVALCAGIIIRFALLALWPELLSLHMQ